MFFIYSSQGPDKDPDTGESCFAMKILPSVDEIATRVGEVLVTGFCIRIKRRLPVSRFNRYLDEGVEGTYDGGTLNVRTSARLQIVVLRGDADKYDELVGSYQNLEQFFFKIVHGLIDGAHPINGDPAYYAGLNFATND